MDVAVPIVRGVEPIERETIKQVAWRLLPLLVLGYFCAYLDRSNVGMAAPTMNPDLGFSNAVFGFGAGIFFLGYFLAEIPSNLILNKAGARRWIARILITWGILSGLTAFAWNDWSFYCIRFLLGLAEAGFYPGVVLYLTWWFPSYYQGRIIGVFLSAGVVSLIIGPPVGGLLLQLDGALGLHGWQWLFIVEALPAVIMCFVTWHFLTDRPTEAPWLRPEQRTWLSERLASERTQREAVRKFSLAEGFYNPKLWLMAMVVAGQNVANLGLIFFLPLIIKGLGVSTNMIGVVSALPYLFALVGMICWGWHSDLTGERTWHVASACLLTAAGLAAGTLIGVGHPVVTMIALIFAATGTWSALVALWALPTALLTGVAAAVGIALITAVGNLGGWLGPWLFGLVKDATGSTDSGLLCLAVAPVISAICVIAAGHDRRMERIPQRS
jgi:ACS family tartrate transporter-like MFS transporter